MSCLPKHSHSVQILMRFCSLDEGFKTSSYLTETILDPELGHSSEANKAAFNKAYNTEEDFWNWLEGPDNKLLLARFGAAMNGLGNMASKDGIVEGSVTLHGFIDHHLILKYRTGRVRVGKPSRGLPCCRCWRRRGIQVIDTCYPFPAPSVRYPGPRARREGCSRGMCFQFTDSPNIVCG